MLYVYACMYKLTWACVYIYGHMMTCMCMHENAHMYVHTHILILTCLGVLLSQIHALSPPWSQAGGTKLSDS